MVTLRISFDSSRLIGILIAIFFVNRVGGLLVCSRLTLGILILLRNERNIVFKRKQTMWQIQTAHNAQGHGRYIEPRLRNDDVDVHLFKKVPITFESTSSVYVGHAGLESNKPRIPSYGEVWRQTTGPVLWVHGVHNVNLLKVRVTDRLSVILFGHGAAA